MIEWADDNGNGTKARVLIVPIVVIERADNNGNGTKARVLLLRRYIIPTWLSVRGSESYPKIHCPKITNDKKNVTIPSKVTLISRLRKAKIHQNAGANGKTRRTEIFVGSIPLATQPTEREAQLVNNHDLLVSYLKWVHTERGAGCYQSSDGIRARGYGYPESCRLPREK